MDGHYPEKPLRMRWATYNRILDKLIAANRILDERMIKFVERLGRRTSRIPSCLNRNAHHPGITDVMVRIQGVSRIFGTYFAPR